MFKFSVKKKDGQDKVQEHQTSAPVLTPSKENDKSKSGELVSDEFLNGIPTLHDLLAPGGIDRSNPDVLRAGNMWTRTTVVTGLPAEISIGWTQPFLDHEGNLDLAFHIHPYDDREALNYLTRLITTLKARLRFVSHRTGQAEDLMRAIADAERIRDAVAANQTRLFKLTTVATVYDTDKDRLHEAMDILEGRLAGRRIYTKSLEARQDEGYLSTLPLGLNFCNDIVRNLDSYGLSTIFPFTDADLVHPGGYQLGINLRTAAPIIYNPYDRSLTNHNIVVYAASGAGKSATVKTMIGRSIFTGERTAVLDPEGEYMLAAQALGGVVLPIGPGSPYHLNPFDISPETLENGETVIPLAQKVLDLVALIQTMAGIPASQDQAKVEESIIENALRQLYKNFGISARDPESIYEQGDALIDNEGNIQYGKRLKRMPQLSDFVEVLKQYAPESNRLVSSLGPYYGDGVLNFFDCQTNINIDNQWLVVFDLSYLDNRVGKPVALQVALTWLWDKFCGGDRKIKKRVIVDEAWLLADHEPAMLFLENMVRRSRKRTAGLTVISQDFRKFARHPRGEAIHSNSNTFIFLRAEEVDLDEIQATFKLSDGERQFIATCGKGEGILRVKGRSVPFRVVHTPFERQWVFTTPLKEAM